MVHVALAPLHEMYEQCITSEKVVETHSWQLFVQTGLFAAANPAASDGQLLNTLSRTNTVATHFRLTQQEHHSKLALQAQVEEGELDGPCRALHAAQQRERQPEHVELKQQV